MIKKILSVSVAAYNAEDFLPKCLDSFLACQKRDALEIIVVDDGSMDNTRRIAERYAEMYPEIFRVIAKENGGHGSTINASLRVATGKYYRVIDSDDWIDPSDMDQLLDILQRSYADMVLGNYREVYPNRIREVDVRKNFAIGKMYKLQDMNPHHVVAMHAINIMTDKLRALGRDIPEHCFYADTSYIYNVVCAADTVIFEPGCVYQYRLGREGQSVSPEGTYRHIEDLMKIERSMINCYENIDKSLYHSKRRYLYEIILTRWQIIFISFLMFWQSDKDPLLRQFYQETRSAYPQLVKGFYLSWKYAPLMLNLRLMLPVMRQVKKGGHLLKQLLSRSAN